MAKTITERFQPKTVIDVGCGTGALLEAFGGLGCEARGLEYSEAALAYCRRRKLSVRKFNLEKDSPDEPRYDLATSFEVAEHLAPWAAKRYVGLLCALSPLVVMSAATPGQGGRDHINEQPQSYWIKKFKRCNYLFDENSSRELSLDWRTLGVTSWYRDNLMVFAQIPQTVMARLAFWQRLYVRLAKLSNRIDATTQGKVLGAICAELRSENARLSYQCAALIEALKVRGATDDFIRIITNERSSTMRPEEISRAIERIR
jgi:SAM-dependent methyltransferase